MKTTIILGFAACFSVLSCGDSPRGQVQIKPPSLILGSEYITEAFSLDMEAKRALPLREMKNILTTHFDTINDVQVGMRWKTKQVTKLENDSGDICFRRTNGIKEVQKIEDDKISISFDGTVEYLEGRNCWMTMDAPDSLIFTASEDNQTVSTVDEVKWDEFQADQFSVGYYNQKEIIKNTVIEGTKTFETFFYSKSPFFLYFLTSRTVEAVADGKKILGFAEVNQPL